MTSDTRRPLVPSPGAGEGLSRTWSKENPTGAAAGGGPQADAASPREAAARPPEESTIPSLGQGEVQRWTARRRMAVVLSILRGETSEDECARRLGLSERDIATWRERMLAAGHNALRSRPRHEDVIREDEIRRLRQKVGELVLEVDQLRESIRTRDADEGDSDDD